MTAAFEWLVRYLLRTSQERLQKLEGPRRSARSHVLVHGLKPLAIAYTEVCAAPGTAEGRWREGSGEHLAGGMAGWDVR